MKIDRTKAVALLVALGFKKAGDWDDDKLTTRLEQVPEKVAEDKVPDDFKELYAELGKAVEAKEAIELEGEEPAEGEEPEDEEAPDEDEGDEENEKPKKKGKAVKKGKVKEEKGKFKGVKIPKAKKEPAERDAFGGRPGTPSAEIRAAVTKAWRTDDDIADETKQPVERVRDRCYAQVEKGLMEVRKSEDKEGHKQIEFRLTPKKAKE